MAYGRGRRTTTYGEFWPGYVDVLSTLLLVVTFLMSVFMVAQFYVSQEASGKDNALRRLTRQIAELTSLLSLEKGKGKSVEDELAAPAGVAGHPAGRQRAPHRPCRCRRRQGRAHRRAQQGACRQDLRLQRGARQGGPAQPAAAGVAPTDGRPTGGAQCRRGQGQGEPGAHLRPRRPPQCGAGAPGAGAAALPFRLLRPPARAAARPQGHPRRRRPLRVPVGGAVPIRPGHHDARRPRRHRPAGRGHRRARALDPARRSTGRCRSTATPTPARSPARSSPPTGSCRARAPPRS